MTDPDSAELDAIKELKASPGYALVVERINEELERKRSAFETLPPSMPDSFRHTKGYVQALRMVLTIPEILANELKEQK